MGLEIENYRVKAVLYMAGVMRMTIRLTGAFFVAFAAKLTFPRQISVTGSSSFRARESEMLTLSRTNEAVRSRKLATHRWAYPLRSSAVQDVPGGHATPICLTAVRSAKW